MSSAKSLYWGYRNQGLSHDEAFQEVADHIARTRKLTPDEKRERKEIDNDSRAMAKRMCKNYDDF